jgi:hypothetical protein
MEKEMTVSTTYPRGSNAWLVTQLEEVNRIIDLLERQWGWLGANEESEDYEINLGKTVATLKRYCAAWDVYVEGGGK